MSVGILPMSIQTLVIGVVNIMRLSVGKCIGMLAKSTAPSKERKVRDEEEA